MAGYGTYKRLNDAEKRFVWSHPFAAMTFSEDANKALTTAQSKFPSSELHNGRGDAFRHCYWNAPMARHEGQELAKEFATAHEESAGQPPEEKAMDLHNNEVGRDIAAKNPGADDSQLAELCMQAVLSGRTIVISGPGKNK